MEIGVADLINNWNNKKNDNYGDLINHGTERKFMRKRRTSRGTRRRTSAADEFDAWGWCVRKIRKTLEFFAKALCICF